MVLGKPDFSSATGSNEAREVALCQIQEVKTPRDRDTFNQIWRHNWLHEGYATPETIDDIAKHYQEFDDAAVDFMLQVGEEQAGTIRLIRDNEHGLPVLNDFEINPEGAEMAHVLGDKKMEITLLTLNQENRQQAYQGSLELMRAFYRYAITNQYPGAFFAADKRLFHLFKRIGFVIKQIGQEKEYEGSLTFPTYLSVKDTMDNLEKVNPKVHDFLDA